MEPNPKYLKYNAALDVLVRLRERFPAAICPLHERHRLPLKVGIFDDICSLMPDLDRASLHLAFRIYCGSQRYQDAVREGRDRLDLDGNKAGVVTAEQAEQAKDSIRRRHAKAKARREDAARRAAKAAAIEAPKPQPKPKLSLDGLRNAAKARAAGRVVEAA